MKSVEEVTAVVADFGTFISVAEKLAETMAKVYYYSPCEQEYVDIRDCVLGNGLAKVQRLDNLLDPDTLPEIDLFVFPDIGFGGLQRYLRSIGKAVWGNLGASELELYRTHFLEVLHDVGLPVVPSVTVVGLSALAKHLKTVKNKWIKVDCFRGNMETWHHVDFDHSERTLDGLAVIFGGAKEKVTFVVQDDLKTEIECGYDGWCIDGRFPTATFQGYEKKNELYLGSLLQAEDLPDELKMVNEAMAPVLKEYGYRDWWATEIRVSDGVPYFIDPTARMPGQTGEHQLETLENVADIIWRGANGELVKPNWLYQYAAEATLHYEPLTKDASVKDEWKTLHLPEDAMKWIKLYHYCKIDDVYHFSSKGTDEVGVVIGVGNSVDEALKHLTENLDGLKKLPVHANVAGFASLLESIKEAEEAGMKFGSRIPKPESILKTMGKVL